MMKAVLFDIGLMMLILVGSAGAEGPQQLVSSLQEVPAAPARPANIPAAADAALAEAALNATSTTPTEPAIFVPAEPTPVAASAPRSTVRYSPPITFSHPVAEAGDSVPAAVTAAVKSSRVAQSPAFTPVPVIEKTTTVPMAVSVPAPVSVPVTTKPAPVIYETVVPSYAYRPIAPVVSTPKTLYVGRGIIGQPTVYVPGQPVRNFFRYFSP